MAPFKRAFFGYRRPEVDAAIALRDGQIGGLEADLARGRETLASLEGEATALSGMVLERERELRVLEARLEEAQECHERSIASLDAVTARLEEMNAQARGQATRIRMKALREAMEVSRRVQALTDAHESDTDAAHQNGNGNGANGAGPIDFDGLYEGRIKLEIGPLGDFSQLVGFEDTIGELGASEISIERFSEGRATLSMYLEEPIDLLQELEEHSALDFKVRHTAPDNLVLDLDHELGDDPEQFAA
jgi:chromosome segregation ATPase